MLAVGLLALVALAVLAAAMVAGGPLIGGGSVTPTVALPPPRFVDVAAATGIDHAYDGDYTFFVGGGVAAFDCDDDRRPDLYLAGGSAPAALYRNRTTADGGLAFERLTDPVTDLDAVTGAYPLDIDGDRVVDLAVLRFGPDVLLRGLGDCRFERANEALGLPEDDGWTVAFSATWEDDASLPTLAFGDYVTLDAELDAIGCPANRLLRPADAGTRYAPPIALDPGYCTLSMLFSDWGRSGRRDLRISNDRHYYRDGEEQLWRIAAGEPPRPYGRGDGWAPVRIWGMGIASQDLTGDGYPEIYLTSQADNKLQTLADGPARPIYEDLALHLGATAHRPYAGDTSLPSTAWHPAFEDLNNDGFVDLYISKGNVDAQTGYAMEDPSNVLIGQADGTFVEGAEAAGIVDYAKARGAAVVDLDGDGLLDIVSVVRRDGVRVWRNLGGNAESANGGDGGDGTSAAHAANAAQPMGHWLAVDLEQPGRNHGAVGAWIAVRIGERVIEREVTVGGGHASGQLVPMHVGLGEATRADVRVTWPDGEVGPWLPVEADRTVRVVRDAAAVEPVAP